MDALINFHSPERIVLQGRINGIEAKLHELKERIDLTRYRIGSEMSRALVAMALDSPDHERHVSACLDTMLEEAFGKRWQELRKALDEEGGHADEWEFPRVEG